MLPDAMSRWIRDVRHLLPASQYNRLSEVLEFDENLAFQSIYKTLNVVIIFSHYFFAP